ncbi:hypothetical protein D0Y83_11200 [Qipengyuania flava]|uniref:Uncharacterized protein n=1 Tax=Qipengyuania flava TaxID=192812 RepID=A0A5P6NCN0_9SPHN|nr:hypothetical protein [Qipengyuania flava]QFI63767.1 hypothetical protein D0Y83_11200 [Qipengyuania flava]
MSNLLQHPATIVRAIHVERVKPGVDLWGASFAGDEHTSPKVFAPHLPLLQLRRELMNCSERCGLPIVVFNDVVGERAA